MLAGLFDEFFGVPTHPLAVHAPVVLIPLLSIASVAVLFRPSWRERATLPIAGLAVVMVAMLFVAKESGEAVKAANNVFGDVDRHEDLANQTFILGIVWLVLAIAAAASRRFGQDSTMSLSAAIDDRRPVAQVTTVLNVLAAIALLVTTIWLIRTGHAGAASRWQL